MPHPARCLQAALFRLGVDEVDFPTLPLKPDWLQAVWAQMAIRRPVGLRKNGMAGGVQSEGDPATHQGRKARRRPEAFALRGH